MLTKLGRFEEALDAFGVVVERYQPYRDELRDTLARSHNPVKYYDDEIAPVIFGAGDAAASGVGQSSVVDKTQRTAFLPPTAEKWVGDRREFSQAMDVVTLLGQSETWMKESAAIIDKLVALLSDQQRADFFPALQQAQQRRMVFESGVTALNKQLLMIQRELVYDSLSPLHRVELDKILAERRGLEPAYGKLPKTASQFSGRVSRMKKRMQALLKHTFQLQWQIEELQRSAEGTKAWLQGNKDEIEPELVDSFMDEIATHERGLDGLREQHAALREFIEREKAMISAGTNDGAGEQAVRLRYSATLDREQEILGRGIVGLVGQRATMMSRIEVQREVLADSKRAIKRFRKNLEEAIREKAMDLRADLLKEQGLIDNYRVALNDALTQAKSTVGEVAFGLVAEADAAFRDIVLRGDVGVIDVAWALKEGYTGAIDEALAAQREHLSEVDERWAESVAE